LPELQLPDSHHVDRVALRAKSNTFDSKTFLAWHGMAKQGRASSVRAWYSTIRYMPWLRSIASVTHSIIMQRLHSRPCVVVDGGHFSHMIGLVIPSV
jgi:hypothetical protein